MVHFNLGFVQLQLRRVVVAVMVMTPISCEDVPPFNWALDSERRRRGMGGRGACREERNKHYKNRAYSTPGAAHRGDE